MGEAGSGRVAAEDAMRLAKQRRRVAPTRQRQFACRVERGITRATRVLRPNARGTSATG